MQLIHEGIALQNQILGKYWEAREIKPGIYHSHDVVIVGAGLTGLRAAIETMDQGLDTAINSKVHPLRSHSVAAQGGINAALGNAVADDSWEAHAFEQ